MRLTLHLLKVTSIKQWLFLSLTYHRSAAGTIPGAYWVIGFSSSNFVIVSKDLSFKSFVDSTIRQKKSRWMFQTLTCLSKSFECKKNGSLKNGSEKIMDLKKRVKNQMCKLWLCVFTSIHSHEVHFLHHNEKSNRSNSISW